MREILSRLIIRLVCISIPLLLIADLSRALGQSASFTLLAMAVVLPIFGLVYDLVQARRSHVATGNELVQLGQPYRSTVQFSLRTLLIIMLVASIYCSFRFSSAVRQRRTVAELRATGVPVIYDDQAANWLEWLIGPEMFGTVKSVTLMSDDEVSLLPQLPGVSEVNLWGPGVSDAAIDVLIASSRLRKIQLLETTNITTEAVLRLRRSKSGCEVVVHP